VGGGIETLGGGKEWRFASDYERTGIQERALTTGSSSHMKCLTSKS
jgi:hypothetical protein